MMLADTGLALYPTSRQLTDANISASKDVLAV